MKALLLFVFILTLLALILFRDKDFSKLSLWNIKKPLSSTTADEKVIKSNQKQIIIKEADFAKLVKFSNSLGNADFKISETGISLTSTLKTALGNHSSRATIYPDVLDGKLTVKVQNLTVAGAKAPNFLKVLIEKAIKTAIDKQVEKGYKLDSIVLSKEQMILVLNKK